MTSYPGYNAGTPLAPRVFAAPADCLSGTSGNPSSTHLFGCVADDRLQAGPAVAWLDYGGCRHAAPVRVSPGRETAQDDVDRLLATLDERLNLVRQCQSRSRLVMTTCESCRYRV